MKATLLTRSVYLTLVLIVTTAVDGCIVWPGKTTYTTPEKPSGLEEGKTSRTLILKKLGNPREQTADGRVALHKYGRTRQLHVFGVPDEAFSGHEIDEFRSWFLLLVVYDQNDIAKHFEKYKCTPRKYKKGGPLCRGSQNKLCGMLIEIDDVRLAQRYCGHTALYWAVWRGDTAAIKRLLRNGADTNVTGEDGDTTLHRAAARGYTAVVETLLAAGADVNVSTEYRRRGTPLHTAVWHGQAKVVEILLAYDADVRARNAAGETPRELAKSLNRETIASLLSQHGANE